GSFYDSGWRLDSLDLSPWANQIIQIDFRVRNGLDPYWPTWVFLDNVRLQPGSGYTVNVPLVLRSAVTRPSAQLRVEAEPTQAPRLPSVSGRPSRK
ncbi:MAG: hypothetical protein JXA74_12045, partial [Anaerolineae bacterium]|nr:hypothetical protein [Anaerolineae bacterium]